MPRLAERPAMAKARQQAQTRIAKADGAVAKDLEVNVGCGIVNGGVSRRWKARARGSRGRALLAAPDSPAVVMDVRLGRDMRLDAPGMVRLTSKNRPQS